jgi:phage virion morphogenesis protein
VASSIKITGLEEVTGNLDALAARLDDMSPVMRVIAEDIKTLIDDSFDKSRSPDGQAFAPLKPATVKKRRGGSSKPLVDTARLRNSIVVTGSKKSVKFGTNVPYAGFHQLGTSRVEPRPYMPVEASGDGFTFMTAGPAGETVEQIKAQIVRYLKTGEVG